MASGSKELNKGKANLFLLQVSTLVIGKMINLMDMEFILITKLKQYMKVTIEKDLSMVRASLFTWMAPQNNKRALGKTESLLIIESISKLKYLLNN